MTYCHLNFTERCSLVLSVTAQDSRNRSLSNGAKRSFVSGARIFWIFHLVLRSRIVKKGTDPLSLYRTFRDNELRQCTRIGCFKVNITLS